MAATDITMAQFRSELGAAKTAVSGADWASAWRNLALAEITLGGLEESLSDAGAMMKLKTQLQSARDAVRDAQNAAAQSTDEENRLIVTRTNYGSR